MFDLADDQ